MHYNAQPQKQNHHKTKQNCFRTAFFSSSLVTIFMSWKFEMYENNHGNYCICPAIMMSINIQKYQSRDTPRALKKVTWEFSDTRGIIFLILKLIDSSKFRNIRPISIVCHSEFSDIFCIKKSDGLNIIFLRKKSLTFFTWKKKRTN